jgi:hypothetical protein
VIGDGPAEAGCETFDGLFAFGDPSFVQALLAEGEPNPSPEDLGKSPNLRCG